MRRVTIREARAAARRRAWLERLGIVLEVSELLRRLPAPLAVIGLALFVAVALTALALVAAVVGFLLDTLWLVAAVVLAYLAYRAVRWRRRVLRERAEVPF